LAGGCPGFPLVTRQACLLQGRLPGSGQGARAAGQAEEVLVADAGRVAVPRLEGCLAGDQFGVAGGEAAVAVFLPAADQYPIFQAPANRRRFPALQAGVLYAQGYLRAGMRGEDQPVQPLEQRPVPWRYPADAGLHLCRHDGGHVPGLRFDPVS